MEGWAEEERGEEESRDGDTAECRFPGLALDALTEPSGPRLCF